MDYIKRFFNNTNVRLKTRVGALVYKLYSFLCKLNPDSIDYCEVLIEKTEPYEMVQTADKLFTEVSKSLQNKLNDQTIDLDTLISLFKEADKLRESLQDRIDYQWYKGNNKVKIVVPTSNAEYLSTRNKLFVRIVNTGVN